jgi:Ser/Thr protein kinase RdoA (MazF antagonist)
VTGWPARLAPRATHDVRVDAGRGIVVKRFRSWDREEPAREWRALCLLAEHAPGLAPRPLGARLNRPDRSSPEITMSWLPGRPLSATAVTPAQVGAVAHALDRLWRSVPPQRLDPSGGAANPARFTGQVRQQLAAGYELGADVRVRRAAARASGWLARGAVDRELAARGQVVLGHGDPNLANFLWDGREMHLVDFEDSGPSDRAFELAILVEHVSVWSDAGLDAATLLGAFELTAAEQERLLQFRRLAALFWLMLLRPGGPGSRRNPPGTLRRQADRLLALLG